MPQNRINQVDDEYSSSTFGFTEEITDDNFYEPTEADYIDFGEEEVEWDVAADRPGLWENIRRKKEREGKNYKPAKTEKEGRPTQEQLKRAQSEPTEKQKKALDKNKDGKISKEDFEIAKDEIAKLAKAQTRYAPRDEVLNRINMLN